MFKLIKYEILYFKIPLMGILLLLIAFSVFALNNIEVFNNIEFLRKYFWAMTVGLGAYGLVFSIWMQRVKEKHERLIFMLPTKVITKNWSRWIFAVVPFLFAMVYIQLLHFFLSKEWDLNVGRISAQLGFLSMALASILIVRDLWFVKANASEISKIFMGAVVFVIVTAGAIIITEIFSYDIVPPFYIHQEELMFFLWGMNISSFALIIFEKRKSYLE